ncbi:MAG: acyl carrier protein [Acidaminococcaceae bacterium]|nr:acyl carrier protein [Acidaminococcaceae bacterium]
MQDFLAFVAGVMQVDPAEISGETRFKEYKKWDSLMHMRLVMEIEEEYDVEIPIEDVPNIKTLNDFYRYTQA